MKATQCIKDLIIIATFLDGDNKRAVTNVITRLLKVVVGSELFSLIPYMGFSGETNATSEKIREHIKNKDVDYAKLEQLEYLLIQCNLICRSYEYSQYHGVHVITSRPCSMMFAIADYAIDVSRYINTSEDKLIKFNLEDLGTAILKLRNNGVNKGITKDPKTLRNVADSFISKAFSQAIELLEDRHDIAVLIASYIRNVTGMCSKDVLFYGFKPVDAGDVPSKAQAGTLYQLGLLTHGVYKDEQGFRILTYLGHEVGKLMQKEESSNA